MFQTEATKLALLKKIMLFKKKKKSKTLQFVLLYHKEEKSKVNVW